MPQENYVRARFIDARIDELLPEENFFFFKIFKETEQDYDQKNQIESEEIKRLIDMTQKSGKFYLKSG